MTAAATSMENLASWAFLLSALAFPIGEICRWCMKRWPGARGAAASASPVMAVYGLAASGCIAVFMILLFNNVQPATKRDLLYIAGLLLLLLASAGNAADDVGSWRQARRRMDEAGG